MEKSEISTILKNFSDNGISHDTARLHEVLRFQDIIGRMSFNTILDNYSDMDKKERGTFLWVSCSCLDKDTFLEIVKNVVCNQIIYDITAEVQHRYSVKFKSIEDREQSMLKLEKAHAVDVEKIKHLELQLENHKHDLSRLSKKAQSYDTIKSLLR